MANKVVPMNSNSLDLDNLNPDINGDGQVEDWERSVYDSLRMADADKDGFLTRGELFSVISNFSTLVAKTGGGNNVGIPIASLNPDTDGDGQIEPWEAECYEAIKNADEDKSGAISVKELFGVMRKAADEVKAAKKSSGIPIETLNPDSDGDGKVEPWEVDVFERIKAADADASGVISTKELFGVIKGAAESDRMKKLYRKAALVLAAVVLFLIAALVAVSIVGAMVGGEAIKESNVPECSASTSSKCGTKIVATNVAESAIPSVFALGALPTNQMSKLEDITFYIDMSADPNIGRAVEANFKIAGGYKYSDTQAYYVTPNDYTIALDSTAQTGTIRMSGNEYPVLDMPPSTGRRLETSHRRPAIPTLTMREALEYHTERRRLMGETGDVPALVPIAKMKGAATGSRVESFMASSPAPDIFYAPIADFSPGPDYSPAPDYPYRRQANDILSDFARELQPSPSPMPSPAPALTTWFEDELNKPNYVMSAKTD